MNENEVVNVFPIDDDYKGERALNKDYIYRYEYENSDYFSLGRVFREGGGNRRDGKFYLNGKLETQNTYLAVSYFYMGSLNGCVKSQYWLGSLLSFYFSTCEDKNGVFKEGIEWLKKASLQGCEKSTKIIDIYERFDTTDAMELLENGDISQDEYDYLDVLYRETIFE